MLKDIQVAAFEGGSLRVFAPGERGREAVLALPLSRLIVKVVRVPAGEDAVAVATPVLQRMSPFPDEPLTVSCETVREGEDGTIVMAAALPESAADDIAEALDGAKLNVTRVDSLAIGQLRGLWASLGAGSVPLRRLVLIRSADCISLIVLDDDQPLVIRAVVDEGDLKREIMLSLLEAEDFGSARDVGEVVYVTAGDEAAPETGLAAPARRLAVGADAALVGVAERSEDPAALNALPSSWAEVLSETRFKAKLVKYLSIAGGVWLLAMAILFGVPIAYGFMTDHQKSLSKRHARQYAEVKDMKAKVDLIGKYADHNRGALEIMKAISDRLPEGVTLSSWNFKRDEGVRLSGEADAASQVYEFKNVMAELAGGDEGDGEKVFPIVELSGPSASKGGKQRFDLDLSCATEEDQ